MAINAQYNGKTYQFPDGTSEDQIYSYLNQQTDSNTYENPMHDLSQIAAGDPNNQPQQDTGSILGTIGAGVNRLAKNTMAYALQDDPDYSGYELAKAKKASQEYHEERNKLGTISGLVADVGTYAPVVAAGMINPALGAGVMGGLTTADTLAQQQEAGQAYDAGEAATTGIYSGATDMATAGLAGRGVNIAQQLSRPAARVAGEIGSQAAQAGASNAATTAYQNLALGRPWDENIGEAALVGGITGGVMHGAGMAASNAGNMAGFAQKFQRPINDDGRRAVQDSSTVSNEVGGLHQDFANNAAEHANEYGNQFNELMDMPVTEDVTPKVSDMVDASMSKAGDDDAALAALSLAQKRGAPLTAKALDIDVGGRNLARDVMGKSERDLEHAGSTLYSDMSPLIFGKEKAKAAGYNSETQMKNLRNAFDTGYSEILNPIRSLRNNLSNMISDKNSSLYNEGRLDPNYSVALNAAKALDDGISKYSSGKSIHKLDETSLRNNSITLLRSLNETGMLRDLKNFDGTAFNPIKTARSAYAYSDMFHAQNPSIHDYNPNTLKEEGKESSKGAVIGDVATDAMLAHFGIPPVKTIARLGRTALRPMKNRKAFDKAREEANSFITDAQNSADNLVQRHLEDGNVPEAADSAARDLQDMGISTGDSKPVPEVPKEDVVAEQTAPEESTPVESVVEPRTPTDGVMARTPRRELPREEVVADPEVTAADRAARQEALAQDARVDSNRRTPVEESTEAVQEAPQESVDTTETNDTTPGAEAGTEAPKEVVDYKEKVMLPVRKREAEFSNIKNKDVKSSMPKAPEWRKIKEFRENTEHAIKRYAAQPNSGISEQGIYAAIDNHGGIDQLTKTMEERGQTTVQQVLPSVVNDYKVKLSEEAKEAAQRVVDRVVEDTQAETVKQRDESVETLRADMQSASKEVTDDIFDRAIKMAEDNVKEGQMYTTKQVGNFVKRILNEEAPKKESKSTTDKPLAKPKPTAEDSYKELNEYARDVFVDGDGNVEVPREIRKAIDRATRTRSRGNKGVGLSDSGMKNVMNKMHDYIDNQIESYEAALSKPDTAQPTEVAAWRKKVSNLEQFRKNKQKANEAQTRRVEFDAENAKAKADKLESIASKKKQADLDKAISKVDEKVSKPVKDNIKKAIDKELQGKNPDEIGAISEAIVNNIPENLGSVSDPAYQLFDNSVDILSDNLGKAGLRDDAKAIKLTRNAIKEALKRKEEFPNNPDLWLSQSDMRSVNDALKRDANQVSTYMGDLGVRARLAVFGSSNTSDMVIHSNAKIKELMAEERKRQKADLVKGGVIGDFGIDSPDIK